MKSKVTLYGLCFLAGAVIMKVVERSKDGDIMEEKTMNTQGGKYSVFEVANWFLEKELMDQKKLQKMCYFAYAWYLYFCNDIEDGLKYRLFNNDMEGWVHGPVSRNLYRGYPFKGMEILNPMPKYGNINENDYETINILNEVYDVYGKYTGNQLEAMTHKELPWIESRNGLSPYEPGNRILKDETIFNYFSDLANQ